MLAKIMDTMFGCRHPRYSFPLTIRAGSLRAKAGARTGTYVTCLDCGREFSYDWQEMKVASSQLASSQPRETAPSLVTKEAS
ncbi:MAG: hypothetical protein WAL71_04895 [Terriglobales bacterium]|jgi:hypothetical protein